MQVCTRLEILSGEAAHTHLRTFHVWPVLPGMELFAVFMRRSLTRVSQSSRRLCWGHGGGSSDKHRGMSGGAATKKQEEKIVVISAWLCVSPCSPMIGGTLVILRPCRHLATSQMLE